MKTHFTEQEISDFKAGSINYPLTLVDDSNNIVEVHCINSISGMSDNKGIPSSLSVSVCCPNREEELREYFDLGTVLEFAVYYHKIASMRYNRYNTLTQHFIDFQTKNGKNQ